MDPDRETTATTDVPPRRLRISAWSLMRAILIVVGALAAVAFFAAARRPLGWVAVAVILAALLQPAVAALSRFVPRGVAIPMVLLAGLGLVAGLAFGVIGDLSDQVTRLERAAPRAARDIERSDRFGDLATEVELGRRVNDFVEDLPDRLQGGDEITAIRSAATRGVTYIVTLVLTIFLMVSGPRLLAAGFEQLPDAVQRDRLRSVLDAAHARWWRYLVFTLGRMAAAGTFTFLIASLFDVPAPVVLGLWVAMWSMVPTVGVVVGSTAVALLAVPDSFGAAASILVYFAAYQVAEDALVQPRLERRSLHVGAFLTFVAAVFGLEIYGIGGLIGMVVVVVFAAAVVKEIGLEEDEGIIEAAAEVLHDDDEAYRDGDEAETVDQETQA